MNTIKGNVDVQMFLEEYLSSEQLGGLILLGVKGIGKYLLACRTAAQELKVNEIDKLVYHPDYILIQPNNGSIKVEQIQQLQSVIKYYPTSNRRVILIDDADTMTDSAQNCLLKILEDKQQYNFFIMVAHNKLLPTIHSRAYTLDMNRLSNHEMYEYLMEIGIDHNDALFFSNICNGCIGTYYQLLEDPSFLNILKNCLNYFRDNSTRDAGLMKVFNIFKEKEIDKFIKQYKLSLEILYDVLSKIFYGLLLCYVNHEETPLIDYSYMKQHYTLVDTVNILESISDHRANYRKVNYSKDDFFDFVRSII